MKWSAFAQNIEPGPNAYQKPENRGGLERPNKVVFSNDGRTMYVVDYGEVFADFQTEASVLYRAQVRRHLGHHVRALARWAVLGPPARLEIGCDAFAWPSFWSPPVSKVL